jgi:hypothetical protein
MVETSSCASYLPVAPLFCGETVEDGVKRTGGGGIWRRCYYSAMDDALRVIRTFVNKVDADIARSALEAAGIDAMIRSDDCGGTRPHMWMGGVELLVREEDAAEADEVLGTDAVSTESRDDAAE